MGNKTRAANRAYKARVKQELNDERKALGFIQAFTDEQLKLLCDRGDTYEHSGAYTKYVGKQGSLWVEVTSIFSNVCNCITLTEGITQELETDGICTHIQAFALPLRQVSYEEQLKTHKPSPTGWVAICPETTDNSTNVPEL